MFTFNVILYVLLHIGIIAVYSFIRKILWRKGDSPSQYRQPNYVLLLFVPIVGVVLNMISDWHARTEKMDTDGRQVLDRNFQIAQGVNVVSPIQIEKEINIVPLAESLTLSPVKQRRRLLLDLLKSKDDYPATLLVEAVNNEDTETAHYAASAIVEIKRDLLIKLREYELLYKASPTETAVLFEYAKVLKQYMESGFLNAATIRQYEERFCALLDEFLHLRTDVEEVFIQKIHVELELNRVEEAKTTAAQLLSAFPQSEKAYMAMMKVHYQSQQYDQLTALLQTITELQIPLSNETIRLTRYWLKGAKHAR